MASKGLYLTIKRPNGKTYIVPIAKVTFPSTVTEGVLSPINFKQYDPLKSVWEILELPVNGNEITNGSSETWNINGVDVLFTFYKYSDGLARAQFTMAIGRTFTIFAPYPPDSVMTPSNYFGGNNTQLVYNYNDNKYWQINSPSSIQVISQDKEQGRINTIKPTYEEYLYRKGTRIYDNFNLKTNNVEEYFTDPIGGIRTSANQLLTTGNTSTNSEHNFTNEFIEYLKSKGANIGTPPTYPGDDDQPEDDDPMPGDGDDDSDPITKPPIPTWDVTNTGFVVIYNPSVTQIRELAYFMWSGDFADLIKKVFREPFQALISLKILFCPIVSGPEQTVWLGNVETDVAMPKVTQQFIDVDMGSIQINEYFGSFADYEPYTRIQIFLPFIGYKELNTDEVMNSTLSLSYRVDVYSGACIAFLTITKTINGTDLDAILYQFDGNCAMEIPFTSNDNSRYIAAILNSASSASMAVANTSNFTPSQQPTQWTKGEKASLTIGSLAPVANGLIDIMATKPNVQRAGALAGAVAALGVKQPYVIIHRPIKHMPSNYSHYLGIPSNLAKKLSAVTGYTIVSQIFLSSAIATEHEITMITEILKSGVII